MGSIEILVEKGEYTQALEAVNIELTSDEYNIELLKLKGQISHKLELYNDVIIIYNSLINLIPSNAENYASRGLAYHAIKEHNHTLADFSTAIDLEPDNGYRYASRAFIKDYLGDHLGAIEDYNKAVELDPEDAISLNNRGLLEEKLGRMHLAQESFARANELAGIDNQTHKHLAQTAGTTRKNVKVDFKYYLGIIKGLLSSASERQKFIRFLLKR
jgi:tetratricopeptide (TPR) repeat protein